jgi:hypothetical protein
MTEYLKVLGELYQPESAAIVKDLLNGAYPIPPREGGDTQLEVLAPLKKQSTFSKIWRLN